MLRDHLFGKELFIRFTASAFRKLPSIYVFSYFSFGFEGRMWDLIVSVPDHCLSFHFLNDVAREVMLQHSSINAFEPSRVGGLFGSSAMKLPEGQRLYKTNLSQYLM